MIGIASDHAGFKLKSFLLNVFQREKVDFKDYGPPTAESTDYPPYARKVAQAIQEKKVTRGILICGSGLGMSIAANRYKDVRAALCLTPEFARLAREHNDANVLVLASRFTENEQAREIVNEFLATSFSGDRHEKRVKLIEEIQ